MTLYDLANHLDRECYQRSGYCIGDGWTRCGEAFCLDKVGNQFEIFYVERGERGKAIRRCESETEACEAFLEVLDRDQFSRGHCIGIFTEASEAEKSAAVLTSAGISVHRDVILYNGPDDRRYRIFVFGRDFLRVRETLNGCKQCE